MNREEIRKEFIRKVLLLIKFVNNKYTKTELYTYRTTITDFIESRNEDTLRYFLKYVYLNNEYRDKIRNGDEQFFMNNSFNNLDNMITKRIFAFKEIWSTADNNTKTFIKKIMLSMIELCDEYIEYL